MEAVGTAADLGGVLEAALDDWQCGWTMGSFGAIAEFHRDPGEAFSLSRPFVRATNRGAIRLSNINAARPVAYETLSPKPHRWTQGIALCLPEGEAAGARRTVLTELGPDRAAIRPEDRQGMLFDMGLAQHQVDFCVRTADPDLIAALRAGEGRALSEPGNPAMGAILVAHPHRVALGALGRCEVYQKIGGPETGGVSPPGPHTHVLPALMATGRTHSANQPVPAGFVPVASLHPGNPVMGPLGEDRGFDPKLFDAFQGLLSRWGMEPYVAAKHDVWAALDAAVSPERHPEPAGRLARTGVRNALRQRRRRDGRSDLLDAWAARFDRGAGAAEEADPDRLGH